jgi:hypothetical protein
VQSSASGLGGEHALNATAAKASTTKRRIVTSYSPDDLRRRDTQATDAFISAVSSANSARSLAVNDFS